MILLCFIFIVSSFSGCTSATAVAKDTQDLKIIHGSLEVGYNKVPFTQFKTPMSTVESREGRLLVQPFEIDLELTDQAQKSLRERNETIVLAFIFTETGRLRKPKTTSSTFPTVTVL